MNEFKAIPFVNGVAQTINPGDKVLAITTGYSHSTETRMVTYLGVMERPNGEVDSVKVTYTGRRWKYKQGYSDVEVKSCLPLKRIFKLAE